MNKNYTKRSRSFNLVVYCGKRSLFKILRAYNDGISNYAFMEHDKDVFEDDTYDENDVLIHAKGDLKQPHIHLLIDFYHAHTFTAVKKMFTTEEDSPRVEFTSSRAVCFRYLCHLDNPEKYQYDYKDIVSSDIAYYEKFCKQGDKDDRDNIAEKIINDLLCNVPPAMLVSRYGRDFVIHMRQYEECAYKIQEWQFMHRNVEERSAPHLIEDDDEQLEIPFN